MIGWKDLTTLSQLDDIASLSHTQPVLILKHSTRCSISHMAKARLDRSTAPEGISFYYLDLIQHRDISNEIANRFSVYHESPQIILLRNGECVYDQSHNGITMEDIIEQAHAVS
jgi:bacillithiol system protein YtxJ